jgi:thiosulfate dehydrogenase
MRGVVAAGAAIAAAAWLGCSSGGGVTQRERTPADRGRAVASEPSLSPSADNAFACTTCHDETVIPPRPGRAMPGAPLAGSTHRPTFWAGRLFTVGDAVDECLVRFMQSPPLDRETDRARELYAYLGSLDGGGEGSAAQPFTVVRLAEDLPRGDAARGMAVWTLTCTKCHGEVHTGEHRLKSASGAALAAVLPEDTVAAHAIYGPVGVRQAVIEKVRHGSFLGVSGVMPPFSREALSDGDLADVIAFLELY